MCAPHRIFICFYEAGQRVIKIQMILMSVVRSLRRGRAAGKDFLFFLASAFYTQFDTQRRAGNLQAYVAPTNINAIKKKRPHVLAICVLA